MGSLEVPNGANGSIERFGATTKINDELLANFTDRGRMAAALVLVTLTETPYTPVIDGRQFAVEVSNRYVGAGDDEADTPDTVDEAREALAEFLAADVPGSKRHKLAVYKTNYNTLLDEVLPERKTPASQKAAFDEALVESARSRDIQVTSPRQALEIVRRAPKRVALLRLTTYEPEYYFSVASNDAVTEHGHIITTNTSKRSSLSGTMYNHYLPTSIQKRGGRAPGSRIVSDIEQRVIGLRTSQTKR